ncbi:hypothetical protein EJB05_22497, partial [Eragrostis curvula]
MSSFHGIASCPAHHAFVEMPHTDEPWLHGQRIEDIAPRLFAIIPKRKVKNRSVEEGLTARTWISDIQGAITCDTTEACTICQECDEFPLLDTTCCQLVSVKQQISKEDNTVGWNGVILFFSE